MGTREGDLQALIPAQTPPVHHGVTVENGQETTVSEGDGYGGGGLGVARRRPTPPNNTTNGLSRRYTSLHSLAQARIRLLKPEQLTKEVALRTQTSYNKPRRHRAGAPLSHHIPGHDPPEEQTVPQNRCVLSIFYGNPASRAGVIRALATTLGPVGVMRC